MGPDMKSVEVVMHSITSVLYAREAKHDTTQTMESLKNATKLKESSQTRKEKSMKTLRKSRKKITEKSRKKKGRLVNQMYFLPSQWLRQRTQGVLSKMLKTLSCSMCPKVCRNRIGLEIHLHEDHPQYLIATPKTCKKGTNLKEVQPVHDTITIDSDSSFVDIEDLLPSLENESFYADNDEILHSADSDDIDALLRSSESEEIDDLLRSSDIGELL